MDKVTIAVSPLTETPYIGFSEPGFWLIKKDCEEFIPQVLQWLGGSDSAETGQKWEKEITAGGVIEYRITLEKVR